MPQINEEAVFAAFVPGKTKMPTVVFCPEDGQPMYQKKGKYGPYLVCQNWPKCDVSHGLHPDGEPMGVPAGKKTREARVLAHEKFDRFWQNRLMTRREAYQWMQKAMALSKDDAHIASLSFNQCHALMAIIRDEEDRCGF